MKESISCPKANSSKNNDDDARHFLIIVDNIAEKAGIANPDNEKLNIEKNGFICTCGLLLGVRKKDGEIVSLCKFEMQ